jgi:hypothetical protein
LLNKTSVSNQIKIVNIYVALICLEKHVAVTTSTTVYVIICM